MAYLALESCTWAKNSDSITFLAAYLTTRTAGSCTRSLNSCTWTLNRDWIGILTANLATQTAGSCSWTGKRLQTMHNVTLPSRYTPRIEACIYCDSRRATIMVLTKIHIH